MKNQLFIILALTVAVMSSCRQEMPRTFERSTTVFDIGNRRYQVYLPASYYNTKKDYPVMYMMDGQNLFVDSLSYSGHAWRTDQILDSLATANAIEEHIIVGIDNAMQTRFPEYMPEIPVRNLRQSYQDSLESFVGRKVYADTFLLFLTEQLKPLVDGEFRTKKGTESTAIAGSSMGGLISMYALCEYPNVFGKAACFSTHWPIAMDDTSPDLPASLLKYFADHIPDGKRWYFDYGTEGLDQYYERYQVQADSILLANGYEEGKDWITKKFEGHDHKEKYWYERSGEAFEFLLK